MIPLDTTKHLSNLMANTPVLVLVLIPGNIHSVSLSHCFMSMSPLPSSFAETALCLPHMTCLHVIGLGWKSRSWNVNVTI